MSQTITKAQEAVEEIKKHLSDKSYIMNVPCEYPHKFQIALRSAISKETWAKRIKIATRPEGCIIAIKEIPYIDKLESAVREALVYIDDEVAYEKIMSVLEERYGKS